MKPPVKKLYITRSGGKWHPEDIAAVFSLSLRIHGTVAALRTSARQLVDQVCLEHQPNMKRLWREPDDFKVLDAVLKIINRVDDLLGILPGQYFELPPALEERYGHHFGRTKVHLQPAESADQTAQGGQEETG